MKELAKPEQELPTLRQVVMDSALKGYGKPEQEPVSHLWECIGRWSSYLVVNGTQANLAPPTWLVDAVKAATSPPRKEWVGLTDDEVFEFLSCGVNGREDINNIEEALRKKNG
jgi:hypothetical protein